MSFSPASDFSLLTSQGLTEYTVVHKFGRNEAVGSTMAPVCYGGVYQTPQPAAATQLRVKAGNANDTAGGTGAREVSLLGLDATGAEVTEVIATAGGSASANSTNSYIRLYRVEVTESGTYMTTSAGSHAADIVIEDAAGANDWLTIESTEFLMGQSEVAAYAIPLGKTGYIRDIHVQVEASKPVNVILMQREGILDAAAPYKSAKVVSNLVGLETGHELRPEAPMGPYVAGTDLIFMAQISTGSASVSVDFEVWLV